MAIKSTELNITYTAYNVDTGLTVTGDSANHTVRISQDGGAFATATNTPTELGYGVYNIVLTATETNCNSLTVQVSSSTSTIVIQPVIVTLEEAVSAPTAAQVATAVWSENLSDTTKYPTSGSVVNLAYKKLLDGVSIVDNMQVTLLSVATVSDIPTDYATATALSAVKTVVDAIPTATYTVPTTAQIASAVCNEVLSSHTTSGTLGATILETATATTATAISSAVAEINTAVGVIDNTVDSMQQTVLTINSNVQAISGYTDELEGMVQDLPTSSAIADTVWSRTAGSTARTLTASPTDVSGLATSASVSALQTAIDAIPTTTYTIPTVEQIQAGLSTFNPSTDTVTINATQAATMATATGFATPADLEGLTVDLTGIARTTDIPTVSAIQAGLAKTTELPDISGLATSAQISAISVPTAAQNASAVWESDMTPYYTDGSDKAGKVLYTSEERSVMACNNIQNILYAMSSVATTAQLTALQTHGDTEWATADVSGLATVSGLETVQTAVNAIPTNTYTVPTVEQIQTGLATATAVSNLQTSVNAIPTNTYTIPSVADIQSGLAKTADVSSAQSAIITHGDSNWGIDVSGDITVQIDNQAIATAVWGNTARTLTESPTDVSGLATSAGLTALQNHGDANWTGGGSSIDAQAVWEYGERTLTMYNPGTIDPEVEGSVYCTRQDVERRWGIKNVKIWADIDSDEDNAKIQTQISWAIQTASDRIDADMATLDYTVPFSPIPAIVRQQTAALAGAILFNTRAVNISAEQTNPQVKAAETEYANWVTCVYSGVPIIGGIKIK